MSEVKYYSEVEQGSDLWHMLRCGILTASEVKNILTPTLRKANNDKSKLFFCELLAQRITNYVEPQYINDDMLRGHQDEIYAKEIYNEKYGKLSECGFITNSKWGFTLGYSPDGLVGEEGLVEIKSRCQKYQIQSILNDEVPEEHIMQLQTGMLVSERDWIDYISYCGGLPMYVKRVYADKGVQKLIIEAVTEFESNLKQALEDWKAKSYGLVPTERRVDAGSEIII